MRKVLSEHRDMTIQVPYNSEESIIHFIWVEEGFAEDIAKSFTSEEFVGVLEGEFINQISSSRELYWARVETPPLVDNTDLGQVALLHNMSRISILNDTPKSNRFDVLGFAIHNTPLRGTLAPFNGESGEFELGSITEAYPRELRPIAPMDDDGSLLVNQSEVELTSSNSFLDVFERYRSNVGEELYLIIKGKFKNKTYFYKLGFYDNESLSRVDLQRNYHYVISIKEVTQAGYKTLQEALNNAPAQNAGLSVLLEEYTQISDGKSSLTVSGTAFSLHSSTEKLEVSYTFKTDDDSSTLEPFIELVQRPSEEVIDPSTFSFTHDYNGRTKEYKGVIKGFASSNVPVTRVFLGSIRIRFGDLVREVRLELGPKKELAAKLTSYGSKVDDSVVIELTVKASDVLNNSMLPIDFYIDTHYLYPDTEKGHNSNLDIIHDNETDHYHYHFSAREVGKHTIYFKRNLSNKSEIVQIKSDHYLTKDLPLSGNDSTMPYIAQGYIFYRDQEQELLDANAKIWVEPVDMPRSFWMVEKGAYSFQFDKRRVDAQHRVTLYAERKNGTTFKATYPFSYFLSVNPVVVLSSYERVSAPYLYYRESGNKLDMRSYTFESDHNGVSLRQNPDYPNMFYYAQVTYSSSIADDEEIYIYALDYNHRRRLYAVTTPAKLKRNLSLNFNYYG